MIALLLFCCFLLYGCSGDPKYDLPVATNGILQVHSTDLDKKGCLPLKGEWEFYWQKHLFYSDFHDKPALSPDLHIKLPALWKGLMLHGEKLPLEGYGTYRLRVFLDTVDQPLSLKIRRWSSPLNLYINESLITSVGKIGTTPQKTVYDSRPHVVTFTAPDTAFEIIMQVSNFKGLKRSGLYPLLFGYSEKLVGQRTATVAENLLIFGAIFVIGICLLLIYFSIKPSHKAIVYLSISCMLIAVRSLLMGESFFNDLFPQFPATLKFKIELSLLYCFVVFIAMYVWAVFPQVLKKWILLSIQFTHAAFIVVVITCNYEIALYTQLPQHLINIVACIYVFWSIGVAFKNKHRGVLIFTISLAVFFLTIIHDTLVFHAILKSSYILNIGFLLFIVIQAFLVSYLYTSLFGKYSLLNSRLDETTRELQQIKSCNTPIDEEQLCRYCKNCEMTCRELDVARLILEGATNNDIAQKLFISFHTVRRHISNIYKKADVSDRAQFISKITEYGNTTAGCEHTPGL